MKKNQRTTLICTVGTSLFASNLKYLSEETKEKPENWQEIKTAFNTKNWNQLSQALQAVNPTQRICGAEINTIEETIKKNKMDLSNLFFLVSDTEQGRDTGEFLKKYFEDRKDIKLNQIEYKVIEDLQDEQPKKFKTSGLRNLVRQIGEYVQRVGGSNYCALDATGGYKAQIAIAVIIGQALNMPVFYKHERFSEIIDFPPLPINFDYSILAQNAHLLTLLEKGKSFDSNELKEIDSKLRVLLDIEIVENTELYELNAIGQIYLTTYRIQNPKALNLTEAIQNTRKAPTFGNDHHYPDGFKNFIQKVFNETKYIKTARSISYSGQKSIKGTGFEVKKQENEQHKLIATYKHKDFGARCEFDLSDETLPSLTWAAEQLNRKYAD